MHRRISILLLTCMCLCSLFGCHTSMSLTYHMETGDDIKVEVDTTEGYAVNGASIPLYITKEDEKVAVIAANYSYLWQDLVDTIADTPGVSNAGLTTHHAYDCLVYDYDEPEGFISHTYVVRIHDTLVQLTTLGCDAEEAAKIMSVVEFSLV